MKVQNVSIFVGDTSRNGYGMEAGEKNEKGNTIYGGNLNKNLDPVAQKRRQAREQAMKVVGDAWNADKKIDQDIQLRRDKIAYYKLQTITGELNFADKYFI